MAFDKFLRRLETAVQKDRPEHRLKRVRQRRRPLTSAMGFLAAAEDEMFAQVQRPPFLREETAVDELGAGLGQRAFADVGKLVVKLAGEDELEHGVAEKFQSLIVRDARALLVGDRRMRQREAKQIRIAENMTQSGLKLFQLSHNVQEFQTSI